MTDAAERTEAPANDVAERTGGRALLQGGSLLAIGMMLANGGNYVLNLLLGRWLEPAEFADANLMVTLMLLVTAIAVALQLVAARYAGIHQARGTDDRAEAMAAWLARAANRTGIVLGLILAAPAMVWADVFNTESALPFVILAVGMPAYLIQAVGRGVMQGRLDFARLAATFVIEMIVRVAAGLALVAAGLGVNGATLGLTLSFVATWATVRRMQPITGAAELTTHEFGDLKIYVTPVLVLLVGQIIINNGDVMIVKSAFDGDTAGVYAAIALIGRAVFFLSWSAVTTLFPAVAQRSESEENSTGLLLGGVGVVSAACAVMVLFAWIFGDMFFTGVFGDEYGGVNSLLVGYAIATSMFAVANLIVTHQLSAGHRRESIVLVGGAVFQTALLLLFHDSMRTVVNDQLIAMGVLLLAVAVSATFSIRGAATSGTTCDPDIAAPIAPTSTAVDPTAADELDRVLATHGVDVVTVPAVASLQTLPPPPAGATPRPAPAHVPAPPPSSSTTTEIPA